MISNRTQIQMSQFQYPAGHCRLVRDFEGCQEPSGSIDGFYPMDGTRCAMDCHGSPLSTVPFFSWWQRFQVDLNSNWVYPKNRFQKWEATMMHWLTMEFLGNVFLFSVARCSGVWGLWLWEDLGSWRLDFNKHPVAWLRENYMGFHFGDFSGLVI